MVKGQKESQVKLCQTDILHWHWVPMPHVWFPHLTFSPHALFGSHAPYLVPTPYVTPHPMFGPHTPQSVPMPHVWSPHFTFGPHTTCSVLISVRWCTIMTYNSVQYKRGHPPGLIIKLIVCVTCSLSCSSVSNKCTKDLKNVRNVTLLLPLNNFCY